MRKRHLLPVSLVAVFACSIVILAARTSTADETALKAALAAKGIKATRGGLSLQEEGELTKAVAAATKLKGKTFSTTSRDNSGGFENPEAIQAEIARLTELNVELKQKLAQLNQAPIPFKATAVTNLNHEISANDNAIAQLQASTKQAAKSNDDTQKDVKAARDAYHQAVFDARKMADRVIGQYAELSKDAEVIAAIKSWNEATHATHALKPSHAFATAVKKLETLEKTIPSEKIALKQQGTGYYASVAINGDFIGEMLVDSAAPSLLLPHQMAIDAGIKVDDSAETSPFQTADGAEIQARHVVLKTVRVGSFQARNVACGVLPASSKTAKAVLGKSFLGQFKGQVDSLSGELSLVRADASGSSTRRRKKPVAKHTQKKSTKSTQSDEPQE
jgi:clan AA aspartic protease (TIGR02281 family)